MLAPISGPKAGGKDPLTGGDMEESIEGEIELSDGAKGLVARGVDPETEEAVRGVGGASPLPLPKMRPPPSFRAGMIGEMY